MKGKGEAPMTQTKKIAVVTGAGRGIGFETARQLAKRGMKVILAARDPEKGRAAAARLRGEDLDVGDAPVDVTSDKSVREFARHVETTYGRVDVLVNNAGIMIDGRTGAPGANSVTRTDVETLRKTMETNVYGALRVTQALLPQMPRSDARIVNVSSGMGQLSDMNGGWTGYRLSKVSLNALTRIFADELKDTGIRVNSICPGWVKTDMGGSDAPRTPEEGADSIVWLATEPRVPTGGFFRNRQPIPW